MRSPNRINIFIICTVPILAFCQIAFARHIVPWDFSNFTYPFRFYNVECFRHRQLPLWLPYQSTGYPLYGDPQSGWLYPVVWFLSLFSRYTPAVADLEFTLSIIIGGLGIYSMATSWSKDTMAGMFAAVCYTCCGIFVSNAEHFTWIISAAWLPWLFWSYYNMVTTYRPKYAAFFGIFTYLLLTGGYVAFLIICTYLFVAIFIVLLFLRSQRENFKRLITIHITAVALTVACCAFYLYCVFKGMQQSTRINGVPLSGALNFPFSLRSFSTFLLPFPSGIKNEAFYGTDVSMRNGYFGIIALLFLILAFFQKKDGRFAFIFFTCIFFTLATIGNAVPLRAFMYKWLPGMNLFQYPSIFRIFLIIGLLLLIAMSVKEIRSNYLRWRKPMLLVSGALFFVFLLTAFFSKSRYGASSSTAFSDWQSFIASSSFYDRVFLQSIIQCTIVGSFFVITLVSKTKFSYKALIILTVIDLFGSVQLNMYDTVAHAKPLSSAQKVVNESPHAFPIPDNTIPVYLYIDANFAAELDPISLNTLLIKKCMGIDGYNPFIMKRFDTLFKSSIRDSAWHNPPAYFARSILARNDGGVSNKQDVFVAPELIASLQSQTKAAQKADKISCVGFNTNYSAFQTTADDARLLVLQQYNDADWKVRIDGKPSQWSKVNFAYIGVTVPKGKHLVEFNFRPYGVKIFFVVNLLILGFCTFLALDGKRMIASNLAKKKGVTDIE